MTNNEEPQPSHQEGPTDRDMPALESSTEPPAGVPNTAEKTAETHAATDAHPQPTAPEPTAAPEPVGPHAWTGTPDHGTGQYPAQDATGQYPTGQYAVPTSDPYSQGAQQPYAGVPQWTPPQATHAYAGPQSVGPQSIGSQTAGPQGNQSARPTWQQPTFAPQPPSFIATPAKKPKRRLGLAAAFTAVALLAGGIGGTAGAMVMDRDTATVTTALSPSTTTSAPITGASSDVAQIAAKALPSVVEIMVKSQSAEGVGSGFILSSDGLILTNNHVASGAGAGATIQVEFADGKTADATVVGTSPTSDLAVIKAEGVSGLTPATLGDSSALAVGDEVVAIGSPAGLDKTVTSGIVSYLGRKVSVPATEADPYNSAASSKVTYDAIQTDAAINPGNSGGPLLNSAGEVVGINSVIYSPAADSGSAGSVGLGFAIPSNQAKTIVDQILSDAGLSLS